MKTIPTLTALALALAVAAPALGQESGAADPGLSLGEQAEPGAAPNQMGADGDSGSYVDATFVDWERICMRNPEGEDPCQMYQLLSDQTDNSVAEITIFPLPEGQEAAAGATFLAPLETLLPAQLTMRIDGGDAKRYPFTFCSANGCIARVGFTADEIQQFRAGSEATWTLVPAAAPDQEVVATMSLMGFTAAFDSLAP